MSPQAPSVAELMRRLDDVVKRLDRLAETLERGYIPRGEYAADQRGNQIIHTNIGEDVTLAHQRITALKAEQATNRRLVIASFVAPIVIGVVVTLILSAIGLHR